MDKVMRALSRASDLAARAREMREVVKQAIRAVGGEVQSGNRVYFLRTIRVRKYKVGSHNRTILSKRAA